MKKNTGLHDKKEAICNTNAYPLCHPNPDFHKKEQNMNGNTHYDAAALERPQLVNEETANDHYLAEQGITDETMQFSALNRMAEATLALAYEQRTANLIAYVDKIDDTSAAIPVVTEIKNRLGLAA